jgi:hypothetical protein
MCTHRRLGRMHDIEMLSAWSLTLRPGSLRVWKRLCMLMTLFGLVMLAQGNYMGENYDWSMLDKIRTDFDASRSVLEKVPSVFSLPLSEATPFPSPLCSRPCCPLSF